jgi:diguanylate cyclase (GGDEF)-like protein
MPDFLSLLSQTSQMVGVLLIAVQMWPLVRVIRERYLIYWAWAWAMGAGGLFALFVAFRVEPFSPILFTAYCGGGYGFGFLLWAGSRKFATDRPVDRRDLRWVAGPLAFAAAGPWLLPDFGDLYGIHTAIMAAFFVAAWRQTVARTTPARADLGLRMYQGALLALAVLFAHYAVLMAARRLVSPAELEFPHLVCSSVYDLLGQAALALGMVCIAAERMRAELERKNRKLEAAAAELASAARTDPLTGLLNRRGLDDLLARPEGLAAGCVAAVDMNDLKPLNDLHGHDTGDVALRLLARALRTLFRVTDPIVRLGGDEFLVLMPGGSVGELTRRLEKLDAALRGQRLLGVEGQVDVKVAWGVARYESAADLPAAMKAADEAMYRQKGERKEGGGRGSARELVLTGG